MAKPKKRFCPRNHDTLICGRTKGMCRECLRSISRENYIPHPKPLIQFCPKGHDTFVCGRYKSGNCKLCTAEREKSEERIEYIKRWCKIYYNEHKKEIIQNVTRWRKDHPEAIKRSNITQQTNRNLRIVAWTDWNNIAIFDKNKPKNRTIDHIIPLCGDDVAGLHVSWNLQYLTAKQNSSKGNKIDLLWASDWYGKLLEEEGLK